MTGARRGDAGGDVPAGPACEFTGDNGIVAPKFISERTHFDEIVGKFRTTLDGLPQ